MKIRTQIALNIDGVQVPSGSVVDLDADEAKTYLSSGMAVAASKDAPIETATADLADVETADAPRTRTRKR